MILMAALLISGLKLAGLVTWTWGSIWGWPLVGEMSCLLILAALKGLE